MLPFEVPSTAVVSLDQLISERSLVRQSLKAVRSDRNPDWIAAVRALQQYLPLIAESYENYENATFKWRLPWSAPHFKTKLVGGDSELGMVALSLVLCTVRAAEQAQGTKDYKRAGHLLRQGQSFAMYLANLRLETTVADLSAATRTALVHILDAMGHQFLLNKLLDEFPETPISASSAVLHTRIAMHALDEYRHSLQLVPKQLRSWCQSQETFCAATGQVLLAIESSERGAVGKALGHLNLARNKHNSLELLISRLTQQYESDNKLVSFQTIPNPSELAQLPSGRRVYEVSAWAPNQQSAGPVLTTAQNYY